MTQYLTQLHYPDTELTSPCQLLLVQSTRLGSNKYQLCKRQASVGSTRLVFTTMTQYLTQLHYPDTELTSPCQFLLVQNTRLGSSKYQLCKCKASVGSTRPVFSTTTQYLTQLHYPDTELTSPCQFFLVQITQLGSNKYQLCTALVLLDRFFQNPRPSTREACALTD